MQGCRPKMKHELDACWETGRRYDTRAKYYLLPGNRCCPGLTVLSCLTSLSTCPSPNQRQLLLMPHTAPALGTASFLVVGSAQFVGAWRMPAVGQLLPGTCACWNWLILHKPLAQMSAGNNLSAPVNLQLLSLCPRRCNRRQQKESYGREREKIILYASVFVDWQIHLWKMP